MSTWYPDIWTTLRRDGHCRGIRLRSLRINMPISSGSSEKPASAGERIHLPWAGDRRLKGARDGDQHAITVRYRDGCEGHRRSERAASRAVLQRQGHRGLAAVLWRRSWVHRRATLGASGPNPLVLARTWPRVRHAARVLA